MTNRHDDVQSKLLNICGDDATALRFATTALRQKPSVRDVKAMSEDMVGVVSEDEEAPPPHSE